MISIPNDGETQGADVRPDLFIYGIGVEYPPHKVESNDLAVLAGRLYPSSPALEKVLMINKNTGIKTRSVAFDINHPLLNSAELPTIAELCQAFLDHGVKLAVAACRKALAQWGGNVSEITHIVATTCTHSANPGFDSIVVKELGLRTNIERVLLHGVGCSGGLAALRTASNIAQGFSFRRKSARVLVVACEITSTLSRLELDTVHKNQEVRIGSTIFGDGASAVVLGNHIGERDREQRRLELLGWSHSVIGGTETDLNFHADPMGWRVVLTPNVPKATSAAMPTVFEDIVESIPELSKLNKTRPTDFDWALHPGGLSIITGVSDALGLTKQHLRATYEVYENHGNSSSASVLSVLNTLLAGDTKIHIVACAFGPGISVETMVFQRPVDHRASVQTSTPIPVPDKGARIEIGTTPLSVHELVLTDEPAQPCLVR